MLIKVNLITLFFLHYLMGFKYAINITQYIMKAWTNS